ncbi:hypothetical protein HPB49_013908 [Dermacentor silvarum]|uniref:Uncharacterized protein n=1 Tax=Dermacentor silvarum TaxID=543639 RepID=A0ACB8D5Y0_DERSI|nr:hypothetical protein HPB49_013908 [Dermacentor silvarum]
MAGTSTLIIGGDFNDPHGAWGYGYTRVKGKMLWQDIQDTELTLVNEPASPTRIGTGLNKDTTPDLTIVNKVVTVKWRNTFEDLGNDHRIIEIKIEDTVAAGNNKAVKWIDRDKFRKIRDDRKQEPIENIEQWAKDVIKDISVATHTITPDQPVEKIDSRLAHMWEA